MNSEVELPLVGNSITIVHSGWILKVMCLQKVITAAGVNFWLLSHYSSEKNNFSNAKGHANTLMQKQL